MPEILAIDHLFHKLWTKAVGTKDYNKTEWIELERGIWGLWKEIDNTPVRIRAGEFIVIRNYHMEDWTAKNGVSNSSEEYIKIVKIVDNIIRGSGYSLIRGDTNGVARTIVSQLAHTYKFGPYNNGMHADLAGLSVEE